MKATELMIKLAYDMGENYHFKKNTDDDEARDFFRCEYQLCKEKYTTEINRIKAEYQCEVPSI